MNLFQNNILLVCFKVPVVKSNYLFPYKFQNTQGKRKFNRLSWLKKLRWFRKTDFHSPQYVDIDRIIIHPDYTIGKCC